MMEALERLQAHVLGQGVAFDTTFFDVGEWLICFEGMVVADQRDAHLFDRVRADYALVYAYFEDEIQTMGRPQPLIVIPARMASTRLPNKPLADIAGEPMIVQVWRRAMESGIGEVIVACDSEAIAEAIAMVGGMAVLTDPDLPSGSDRVWEAVLAYEGGHEVIINLQGDLPTFDGALLAQLVAPFAAGAPYDIMTLAAPIVREEEMDAQHVVKPLLVADAQGGFEAVDFVRGRAPVEPMYHHIGVYAYRRAALERFVSLPPSARERERKLEQMRALDAGMRIGCVLVDTVPLGVDTQEDLLRAREMLLHLSS